MRAAGFIAEQANGKSRIAAVVERDDGIITTEHFTVWIKNGQLRSDSNSMRIELVQSVLDCLPDDVRASILAHAIEANR